jgi:hypothetical protein
MLYADDLVAPRGRLTLGLFPGVSASALRSTIDKWIAEAYDAATGYVTPTYVARRDQIARAWAYHRGYAEAVDRIVSSPTTVALADKGSGSYSAKQLEILEGRVSYWLAQYEALIAALPATDTAHGPDSASVRARFTL